MNGWLDDIITDTLPAGTGSKLGRQVGCGIASGFEQGLPPFPIFAGEIEYGDCGQPGDSASVLDDIVSAPAKRLMDEVQGEAQRVAEARIRARITPYFVGLPIAFLAIGLGVGYIAFRKK